MPKVSCDVENEKASIAWLEQRTALYFSNEFYDSKIDQLDNTLLHLLYSI